MVLRGRNRGKRGGFWIQTGQGRETASPGTKAHVALVGGLHGIRTEVQYVLILRLQSIEHRRRWPRAAHQRWGMISGVYQTTVIGRDRWSDRSDLRRGVQNGTLNRETAGRRLLRLWGFNDILLVWRWVRSTLLRLLMLLLLLA